MEDIKDYLDPVSIDTPEYEQLSPQSGFPHNIIVNTENNPVKGTEGIKIALLGVPEGRIFGNSGTSKAPDAIRNELYKLTRIPGKLKIADLGNLKAGSTFEDTIAGLAYVINNLWNKNIFPVIIGGSSGTVTAINSAFSIHGDYYNLIAVDSRICYNNEKKVDGPFSYLNAIMCRKDNNLHAYNNIGYQTYLNDQQVINRFLKRGSILTRIGDVRQSIHLMEPLMRDSEAIVFSIASVRQSDAPGSSFPSPNGFYGEEICLLSKYSGLSDNSRIFGLFDVNPEFDLRNQTSALAAQIIWFFLEGFSQKQYETPALSSESSGRFIRYHVRVSGMEDDLIFIKSNLTDRWWMEIGSEATGISYIACSHEDYLMANRNEVPERWIKAIKAQKR